MTIPRYLLITTKDNSRIACITKCILESFLSIDEEDPLSNTSDEIVMPHYEDHNSLLKGDTIEISMDLASSEKAIKIKKCLSSEEADEHFDLLHSHPDIFTWTYEYMPSIDESIVVHNIVLCPDAKLVKQKN